MYSRLFFTILPVLLGAIGPALALPVQSSGSLSVEARSVDFSSDANSLISRDVSAELLIERDYHDGESDVLARAINEDLFPRGARPKKTAAEAQKRKADVRAKITTSQGKK